MKLEAKSSLRSLQTFKPVLKSFLNPIACLPLLLILMLGGMAGKAHAKESDAMAALRSIANQQGITDHEYVQAVMSLIKTTVADYLNSPQGKANPNYQYTIIDDLIAEAVKLKPPYACDIVKAGIQLMTPANGGAPDPKQVASMVAEVVIYIQTSNPDLLETIVTCATEADPDAGHLILNAVAGILANPKVGNLNTTIPTSINPTPTPTPKAPTPVPQVTPAAPI